MTVQKKILLIVAGAALLIYGIYTIIQYSGRGEARQSARDAVTQLKASLDKGTNPEELHTLAAAVAAAYDRKPGAFSDCRKTFTDLQNHANAVQSYWWSETYRKDGVIALTDDCNTLLTRLN